MKRFLTLFAIIICSFCFATPVWAGAKKDKDKEKPVIKLGSKTHEAFTIHSIPKCGTHLFQRLLWLMTGREVVSVMEVNDRVLWDGYISGKILRMHRDFNSNLLNSIIGPWGHRMLCMVRDPRDALVSHAFYMKTFPGQRQRDFFWVNEKTYDSLSFEDQITSLITGSEHSPSYLHYYKVRTDWATSGSTLPVHFEEVIGSKGGGDDLIQRNAIARIAKYVGIKLTNKEVAQIQDRLYRAGPDVQQSGQTFERGHVGNWRKFLTEEHIALIKERYGQLLIDLGYESNLDW